MSRKKSDRELIEDIRKGNNGSFEELISRYSNKVFGLASRLTRSHEDAEEVLQDVFVTVYRKIEGFEGKSSFSSWLYRVTVNSALMKLRKKRQDTTISVEEAFNHDPEGIVQSVHGESACLDTIAMRREILTALEEAIRKLPDEYRPVFVLRDVDGMTSKQVGRMLNLTIPAVKSRLHRSRMMLRRRLASIYREYKVDIPSALAVGAD